MLQDLRYAWRVLRRSPVFAAGAILTLALGIGANTAIFSIVDAAVLRPLPYDESDRIVSFEFRNPSQNRHSTGTNPRDFLDWRHGQQVFEQVATTGYRRSLLVGSGEPEEIGVSRVTAGYFELLRVRPALGRTFLESEEFEGHGNIAIISDRFWRERYAAAPDILGKVVRLDDTPYEIVGVLPSSFRSPATTQERIFVPLVFTTKERQHGISQSMIYETLGRRRPGIGIDTAAARMSELQNVSDGPHAGSNKGYVTVELKRWLDAHVEDFRAWMLMLLGAVGLVLLIACANVANLTLAQASMRTRELTVRGALGASRWRIARQLLAESMLIAVIGATAGLLMAWWLIVALRSATPGTVPRAAFIAIDWRVLLFTSAVALGTGLLCGLLPAFQGSRVDIVGGLKEGATGATPSRLRQRLRFALAWTEVALAVMLLVGAGLFISSFARLMRVDPGIDTSGVLSIGVSPPRMFRTDAARTIAYVDEILASVRRVPGVEEAAITTNTPFGGGFATGPFHIVGRPPEEDAPEMRRKTVGSGLFELLRVPLRQGRTLRESDTERTPYVAVINEAAARRFWPGENPVGQQITFSKQTREIVGVVADIRYASIVTAPEPEAFVPFRQSSGEGGTMLLRVSGTPAAILPAIKAAVWAVAPNQPITDISSVEASLNRATARRRFNTLIMGVFGTLALAIAATGVFGVMAFMVGQRTREIGVRIALGARADQVIALFLRQGLWVLATAIAAGLIGAWALGRTIQSFLFEVQPRDPFVFAAVALVLGTIGMLACWLPARRAGRVDPILALRSE
jgi:putative ABC transport system permease protein